MEPKLKAVLNSYCALVRFLLYVPNKIPHQVTSLSKIESCTNTSRFNTHTLTSSILPDIAEPMIRTSQCAQRFEGRNLTHWQDNNPEDIGIDFSLVFKESFPCAFLEQQ